MAKTSFLELLDSPKLISRKIWETEKSWNFHTEEFWKYFHGFSYFFHSEWKVKIVVPVTLGLCRALGRFGSTDELLISRLFPIEVSPPPPTSQLVTSKQSFSNFRYVFLWLFSRKKKTLIYDKKKMKKKTNQGKFRLSTTLLPLDQMQV